MSPAPQPGSAAGSQTQGQPVLSGLLQGSLPSENSTSCRALFSQVPVCLSKAGGALAQNSQRQGKSWCWWGCAELPLMLSEGAPAAQHLVLGVLSRATIQLSAFPAVRDFTGALHCPDAPALTAEKSPIALAVPSRPLHTPALAQHPVSAFQISQQSPS